MAVRGKKEKKQDAKKMNAYECNGFKPAYVLFKICAMPAFTKIKEATKRIRT